MWNNDQVKLIQRDQHMTMAQEIRVNMKILLQLQLHASYYRERYMYEPNFGWARTMGV